MADGFLKRTFSSGKSKLPAAVRYPSLLIAAAILGVIGLVLPDLADWLGVHHGSRGEVLSERLGDALIVAALIALVLDRPAKTAIVRNLQTSLLWGLINPEAPEEHRATLRALAQSKTVVDRAFWTLEFKRDPQDPELLEVSITIESYGRTWSPDAFFGRRASVLASSKGRTSRYLHYEVRNHTGDQLLACDEKALNCGATPVVTTESDGSLSLDIELARKRHKTNAKLTAGETYHQTRRARVYRHDRGFFPIWSMSTTARCEVKVVGAEVENREFTLTRLDKTEALPLEAPDRKQTLERLPPGCGLLLSWGPPSPKS